MESTQVLSKNQVKLIKSLALKKYRIKHNLFVVEGKKLVEELLESQFEVEALFVTDPNFSHSEHVAQYISEKSLAQVSQLTRAHFGLAVVKMPEYDQFSNTQKTQLVLDGIADPGNMGTIIRLADWYGLANITCVHHCVDAYNPKVVQASMGSVFRIKVQHKEVDELVANGPVYGAFLNAQDIGNCDLIQPCTLIIGNESEGISPELEQLCNQKISIPRYGRAESLNAAIATGIILDRFSQIGK